MTARNLGELEYRAKRGELSPVDFVYAHNWLDHLSDINSQARTTQQRRERLERAGKNYMAGMAPKFRIEHTMPNGDREIEA